MNKYEKMYEDILLACKTGEVVIISRERVSADFAAIRYDAISKTYSSSGFYNTKEEALKYSDTFTFLTRDQFIKTAAEFEYYIVETYTPEYDRVPVKTQVLVKEDNKIAKVIDWDYKGNYTLNFGSHCISCHRSAFTVILPEEEKEEQAPDTLTFRGVEYILTPKNND